MPKKKPPKKKAKKIAAPKVKRNQPKIKRNKKGGFLFGEKPLLPKQMLIPDRDEPESVTVTDIASVKKLTTKIIVGKKIGKVEARTTLYSIIGVATDLKTGESNYGPWTALVGRFEAERSADGAMFAAPLLLLPDEATAAPIIQAVKIHEGVEFALVVSVEPTLSAPGYVYDIATVVSPRKNDMLAGLRNAMQAYVAELPPPAL